MRHSQFFSYIFYLAMIFLVFTLLMYSIPVLIVIAILVFVVSAVLWIANYIYNRVKEKLEENKYDENGLRKTKASIVDIKPTKGNENGSE